MNRKFGTVYSSNPKGWIFIYVTPQERYFAHICALTAFTKLPPVGMEVSFEIAPPRKPGQLPCAVNVQPVDTGDASKSEVAE